MENKLPKGYALKLLKSCELGAKKQINRHVPPRRRG